MKKMTKQLLVAAVALAAFNACSDSYLSDADQVVNPASETTITENSFVLTNASGQPVTTVSSNFGKYYLDIKTDGLWYIETDNNMEFTPTRMYGRGSMRVPVYIGNNWATARQLSYSVKFLNGNGVTRGKENAQGSTEKVDQESATSLENFKQLVNSNIFVGYGYNPFKNSVPELCTGIEIFDMDELGEVTDDGDDDDTLDNDTTATDSTAKDSTASDAPYFKRAAKKVYVKSSLAPQTKEVYYYADSEDDMDKLVSVKANPGGNFNVVKFDLDVDVNTTNISRHGTMTVQKSLTRALYSRELKWANAMLDDANYSEGFKYFKERFIAQLKNAGTDDAKKAAAMEFFNVVGTHFISKALLGCQLDYRMTVDSTNTTKATNVKAALDFKWQQQVKDTTQVDSLEEEEAEKTIPDSLRKNFVFKAKVHVTDSVYNAASHTKADVKARGGEIERVNILTTGGQLLCDDLATWLLATEPEKAAMVGIVNHPIYILFKDTVAGDEKDAHDYLQKIIDGNFNIDPTKYGVIK